MSLLTFCKQVCRLSSITRSQPQLLKRFLNNIYEPDYLSLMIPEIPIHDSLNIQMKGYDYPVLEAYQKQIHKLAEVMDVDIIEGWATPPQKLQIQRYKLKSTAVDSEYSLQVYERNIQICEVPSTTYSVLLRVIQETAPEGITVRVHESLPEHQEVRFIPDNQLLELKQQLTDMGGPSNKDKKKRR